MGPYANARQRRGRLHRRQRLSRRRNHQGAGGKFRSPDPDGEPGGFLASPCVGGIARADRRLRPDIRSSGCRRQKRVMLWEGDAVRRVGTTDLIWLYPLAEAGLLSSIGDGRRDRLLVLKILGNNLVGG